MVLKNVKYYAKKKGLTIAELERTAGLGQNTLYKWKDGSPNLSSLQKVAGVLGVSISTLLKER